MPKRKRDRTHSLLLIYMTASNVHEARRIAKMLLDARLIACANIVLKAESHYVWKGKRVKDSEALLIAKTKKSLLQELIATVRSVHSYECPCIVAVPIVGGNDAYLRWTKRQLAD